MTAMRDVTVLLLKMCIRDRGGVVGPRRGKKGGEQNVLESTAIEHESCVCEANRSPVSYTHLGLQHLLLYP